MRSTSGKKTSSNIERPKPPYVRPQLSRLSLAEARTKLQAQVNPGDAVGQEMLRRIEQLSETESAVDGVHVSAHDSVASLTRYK
jgi:hypothetical protein